MSKGPEQPAQGQFEHTKNLASELLRDFDSELRIWRAPGNATGISDDERKVLEFGKSGISLYLKDVPEEVQKRFVGHGITRQDATGNLAALISIIQDNVLKGDSAPLRGSPQQDAFSTADFFIISHLDKQLISVRTPNGQATVDVGAYIIDTKFYPLVEKLKGLFPNANIIRANELADYIAAELASANRA